MSTLFATSIFILTITPSLAPGLDEMMTSISPLDRGYSSLFSIPERYGILFTLPGLFATAHGFIYAGAVQISSMGQSKLFPEILGRTWKRSRVVDGEFEADRSSLRQTRFFPSLLLSRKHSKSTSPADSADSTLSSVLNPNDEPSASSTQETKRETLNLRHSSGMPESFQSSRAPTSTSPESLSPNKSSIPIMSLIFTSLLCYFLCLVCTFIPYLSQIIFPLSTCCGYLMYLSILSSYIIFKVRYPSCKRYFVNPGGLFSALLSFLIFTICVISLLVVRPAVDIHRYLHRDDTEHERSLISIGVPIALGICLVVLTLYYYRIARGQMHYSEDEQKEMFTLLLLHSKFQSTRVISSPSATSTTGRRSQLQSIRRATFVPSQNTGPQQQPSLPEEIREIPRSTSIHSFTSLTSYLSSRVSFAITRERAYSSTPVAPSSSPIHDLDADAEGGEEPTEELLSLQPVELMQGTTVNE